jgi:hypothetical protein
VDYNFGSIKGFLTTAKKYMFKSMYPDDGAMKMLNEWKAEGHGPLVQIGAPVVVTTALSDKLDENLTVAGD